MRRGRTIQPHGNRRRADSPLQLRVDVRPFLTPYDGRIYFEAANPFSGSAAVGAALAPFDSAESAIS